MVHEGEGAHREVEGEIVLYCDFELELMFAKAQDMLLSSHMPAG